MAKEKNYQARNFPEKLSVTTSPSDPTIETRKKYRDQFIEAMRTPGHTSVAATITAVDMK